MKKRKNKRLDATRWTPERIGIEKDKYQAVIAWLFNRPESKTMQQQWYWDYDLEAFEATPLEWTKLQTLIFSRAGTDLEPYTNQQVGMGLTYIMGNSISNVPFAATDDSVPLADAMHMMQAFPTLWQDCIGPRLAHIHAPIGSVSGGQLGYACYMWFDVWATFWHKKHVPEWRDAMWHVLNAMLHTPFREVQIAALHGIGHERDNLQRDSEIDQTLKQFMNNIENDDALKQYAQAAQAGAVQ